jgi:RNA polymerase sigma-70 factor (ECF subfamily)
MPDAPGAVTVLLKKLKEGDASALDKVMPLVYSELKRIAASVMRTERSGHTLQPTALVHEAYLRLLGSELPDFSDRTHFLAVASRAMRRVLVDHSRKIRADKRGGGKKCSLEEALRMPMGAASDVFMSIDEALTSLEERDLLKVRLIEMRFFGGLTAEESAQVLGMPVTVIRSQLRLAQAYLQRELHSRR